MAVPIQLFTIIEVGKPRVGENKPATVEADVVIDTTGALLPLPKIWHLLYVQH